MSLDNPYGINPGWKVDPDGRYDRSPGPVTTRQMTEEEREKYNQVKGQYVGAVISGPTSEKVKQIRDREMEEKFMATMTKEIVKRKGDKVTVCAFDGSGYSDHADKLCTIKDNGNGYTVKFHSYSSIEPDRYLNIDYSHAEYLLLGLREFVKND